jgi:RNA polymerase sigma-70 factor (ECF subfamily)
MSTGKPGLFAVPGEAAAQSGIVQLSDRDDDELMLLVGGGVRAAFDELVRRHRRRLLGVAMRYVRCPGLAHDVTQNTLLDIYRAAPRYQPRGSFTSFLYRALLNQCRMAGRTAAAQERLRVTAAVAPTDLGETAEDQVLARERERRVQHALDRISDKLRAVVVLRYSGGLAYQEIADVLEIPVGTAKRRLFDALEKLRELLVEEP